MILFWIVGLVASDRLRKRRQPHAGPRGAAHKGIRGSLSSRRFTHPARASIAYRSLVLFTAGGVEECCSRFGACTYRGSNSGANSRIFGQLWPVDVDLRPFVHFSIALLCGIVFGLFPAFESTGLDVNGALKESANQVTGSKRAARVRRAFVAGEIALAVVVLISTAMLVEELHSHGLRLAWLSAGECHDGAALIPKSKYASDAQIRNFYGQVMARVHALPGVVRRAWRIVSLGESSTTMVIHVADRPPALPGEEIGALYSAVSPDYFPTMQIPLIRGRSSPSSDGEGAPSVILINETLMRQQFAKEDPVGKQMEFSEKHTLATIIGVVGDVKMYSTSDRPQREDLCYR